MGPLNKTGPNSNWCFYSGPFRRIICFVVQVFSLHDYSVVFGELLPPLLCSELSNGTLAQLAGVNHPFREEGKTHIKSAHCPSRLPFACEAVETVRQHWRWRRERTFMLRSRRLGLRRVLAM